MTKRNEAQWRALFEQQQHSGLSAAAYCREHKLCPKYFSLRKKQLGWQAPATDAKQAIKLSPFIPVPISHSTSTNIHIHWQSLSLTVPTSVPTAWLADFVKQLA